MREARRNLWADGLASNGGPDAICITTNGRVDSTGRCVMGRGCAREASQIYPGIAYQLGQQLRTFGNHVQVIDITSSLPIVAFPVKHHWKDKADLALIERSARELQTLLENKGWREILLPRPGCGNGQRNWEIDVKPLLTPILDDRVVVVWL